MLYSTATIAFVLTWGGDWNMIAWCALGASCAGALAALALLGAGLGTRALPLEEEG